MKLNELHLRLKNGGAVQDRSNADFDEEDSAGEENMGPSSANETGQTIWKISSQKISWNQIKTSRICEYFPVSNKILSKKKNIPQIFPLMSSLAEDFF